MLHAACMSGSKHLNSCTNPQLPTPPSLTCKPHGNSHRWVQKCIVRCRWARKLHTWQSVTSIPWWSKEPKKGDCDINVPYIFNIGNITHHRVAFPGSPQSSCLDQEQEPQHWKSMNAIFPYSRQWLIRLSLISQSAESTRRDHLEPLPKSTFLSKILEIRNCLVVVYMVDFWLFKIATHFVKLHFGEPQPSSGHYWRIYGDREFRWCNSYYWVVKGRWMKEKLLKSPTNLNLYHTPPLRTILSDVSKFRNCEIYILSSQIILKPVVNEDGWMSIITFKIGMYRVCKITTTYLSR